MRTRIAGYEIIRPVQEGSDPVPGPAQRPGGTEVEPASYLAHPPERLQLDAPVVVHPLPPAPDARRQSERDWILALAAARSPYLPVLLELGPDDGEQPGTAAGSYWSTTYTGDATLASPPFTLSLAFVLWLVAGAARGAHTLHEAGLAHGNITARSVRFNDRAVTLDPPAFAPADPPGRIRQLQPVVDLDVVDPTVARGELPGRSSDIWSLGAILHNTLTATLLHPGLADDPPVTAVQRILFQPPAISTALDDRARQIVTACLHPDPAQRPPTAAALAEALETLGRQQ